MIKAFKQKAIVNEQGKIESQILDLPEGTEVEIIILIPNIEGDETEYLLANETNKKELLEAKERVNRRENLVVFTAQEWHEKYSV